jgi:hypothetical protein
MWLTPCSYKGKYLHISTYIRKLFIIDDFATAPLWIFLYMTKILFYFLSVYVPFHFHCKDTIPHFETNIPRKRIARTQSNFHMHVFVRDLRVCISTIGRPILQQENMWTDPRNIYIAHRNMNVEIGNECTNWANLQVLSYATDSKLRRTLRGFFADFLHT